MNYVFIDEVQKIIDFQKACDSLYIKKNVDLYITGSNSRFLSSDINTIFRGRGIGIKVFPLSFSEFCSYKKAADKQDVFDEYIRFGGMPYAVTEEAPSEKIAYLNMLSDTVVKRDMIDRYGIRNEALFNALLEFLCSAIGSYISTSKIANTLKSNGFKTADNETISRYLSYMCDAFLFYKVQRYDVKSREYLKTQNKYYVTDIGLRNAVTNYRQIEITHIIENIVYIELLRRGYMVDVGKNRDKEIDFVVSSYDGKRWYIQVSYTIEEESTKERELSAFRKLDDGYKKILITMDRNPLSNLERGYQMMHLFDFLLNENALEEA